jgi:hypothetical protein
LPQVSPDLSLNFAAQVSSSPGGLFVLNFAFGPLAWFLVKRRFAVITWPNGWTGAFVKAPCGKYIMRLQR